MELMKWAYPREEGRDSGIFCWYCPKTVEFARPEFTMQEWVEQAKGEDVLKDAFGRDRNTLIER